ncbi:MAG: hypothetical protein ACP5UM_12580, partial [Anaerolineae bacterium]
MCRPGTEARIFARGAREEPWEPLRQFLLPLPVEVVEEFAPVWCGDRGAPILIPFSQSAAALGAASRYGRVVASDPNPLTALLQGLQVRPPPPQAARRVLRTLADRLVKGARLGEVLPRLYETPCPSCGRSLIAEAFLWDRELRRPVQRKIRCAPCGLEGWVRAVPQDAARFAEPEKKGFHYWRVLDLLARRGEALYPVAREFLDLYTSRNLQALDLLVTEAASAFARDEDRPLREVAWAMLIGCLDLCSSLQPAGGLPVPRRLRPARRFLERNAWLVLEEIAAYWEGLAQGTADRQGGEIHLHSGPVGEAFGSLRRGESSLAILSPPPPHPIFWHLTYFWACWLWGREAAEKTRPLLHLAGPSWTWYVQALTRALRVVSVYLEESAPLVLWLRQDRYLAEAVLLAAASAGFVPVTGAVQFREIAPLSTGGAEVVALFRRAAAPARGQVDLPRAAQEVARSLLARLQEPISFAQLWGAFYWHLLEEGALPDLFASKEALVEMVRSLEGPLRDGLAALTGSGEVEALGPLEQGRPAPAEEEEAARPPHFWRRKRSWEEESSLTDRVEFAVWSALLEHPGQRAADLCREVYGRLGGLCTPPAGWVEECLRSYGEEGGGRWGLRPEDRPERRWEEFWDLLADLRALGQALGFRVVENQAHLGRCHTVWGEVPAPPEKGEVGPALLPLPFAVGWMDEGRLQ